MKSICERFSSIVKLDVFMCVYDIKWVSTHFINRVMAFGCIVIWPTYAAAELLSVFFFKIYLLYKIICLDRLNFSFTVLSVLSHNVMIRKNGRGNSKNSDKNVGYNLSDNYNMANSFTEPTCQPRSQAQSYVFHCSIAKWYQYGLTGLTPNRIFFLDWTPPLAC